MKWKPSSKISFYSHYVVTKDAAADGDDDAKKELKELRDYVLRGDA